MIELLKAIERDIGLDIVINFLTLICGIGIGAATNDAINNKYKDKDN